MGPEKTSGGRVEGTLIFFEDPLAPTHLPPPTLSQARPLQDDDRLLVQPAPKPTHEVPMPANASVPSQSPTTAQVAPLSGMTTNAPEPTSQEHILFVYLDD